MQGKIFRKAGIQNNVCNDIMSGNNKLCDNFYNNLTAEYIIFCSFLFRYELFIRIVLLAVRIT